MKDKILEAVQISKTYGEGESAVHALRNSDLTLENGTFASIIGSSGSGKSTLLKILGGLLPPTTGKVLLDGQDIYAMNAEQLAQVRRQKIGFIFQDFRLFPEYTVQDNILTPFYLDHRAPDEQMLHKLTGILGIAGKLHSRPAQLSGGQQQRVALARILVYEPDVIMLDEPFSALDYYLKEQLQFQVREVLRGYTGDVLMVSHSRDEVYRFCEKSIILNRGQVAMKGETRAIFQKPENVTAARLTGCKNFSRIRRIGEYEVEALDWGLTFQTEEAVAAEHAYIGIRAHQFYPAHGSANEFTCEWRDTLCQPFEWDVLLRPVENAGAAGDKENALEREVIWWKVDYKQSDLLNQYQRGDRVRLGIAPGDIMLLKEG